MLTRSALLAIMPRAATVADQVTGPLAEAMMRFEILGPRREAAFLAQLAHESGELRHWSENLTYSWPRLRQVFPRFFKTDADAQPFDRQPERIANRVYGGRMGNGPEASGDGWRYRGRGPIQLTGKDNYRACGAALGVDLLAKPELLEQPETGCLAAAWFWTRNGLNALADAGDFVTITRRINPGLAGQADREAFWERAKLVLGVEAAPVGARGVTPRAASGPSTRAAPGAKVVRRKKRASRPARSASQKSGATARPSTARKRAPARGRRPPTKRRSTAGTASRRRRAAARRSGRRRR